VTQVRTYLQQVVAYLKGELEGEEKEAFEAELERSPQARAELEKHREVLDLLEAATDERIIKIVHGTLRSAFDEGASDVHVVPERQPDGTLAAVVYFRLHGQLHEVERHPNELRHSIVDRWKIMSECSLKEHKLLQEGHIGVLYHDRNYEVRVTVIPTIHGERVAARILPQSSLHADLASLGLSTGQLETVRRWTRRPSGLVVVAGPIGSGKTTLLYSMLLEIHAQDPHTNLMTVEDPVEFILSGERISQTSVDRHAGLTFANALRGVLRSDPDLVLVGDLPDRETAELALRTAMTGRRVLTSLVANSALGGLQRLKEMSVDPAGIAQATAGVISQRLVRQPCPECATQDEPPPAALERLGLSPADGPFRRGAGCAACRQTGYGGRVALTELLELDDSVRRRLVENAPMETLWQETLGQSGRSLWDDAREKIRQGLTTVEEVTRALFDYPYPAVGAI
jgi:type II secretory ATPase GspE/PulE/Tfp pilus assembly ATPase PilB-like protein